MSVDLRSDELAGNLRQVRARIAAACAESDRDPAEVSITVVTKFFPADDVRRLARLGLTELGENRHQEAEQKAAEVGDLDLRWHFIGGLQSNKAAAVAGYADVVESVDRAKLLPGLARGAQARGAEVEIMLQVSLDPPNRAGRSGVAPAALGDLAGQVAQTDGLRLTGLMAVAPLGADPDPAFARLAEIRRGFLADFPQATALSAGMSGDLEAAIRHGATHVRVGSAILGPRPVIK